MRASGGIFDERDSPNRSTLKGGREIVTFADRRVAVSTPSRVDSPTQEAHMSHGKHHRHTNLCIVPPHMLRGIAANARSRAVRDAALRTLSIDQTFRLTRVTHQLLETRTHNTLVEAALQKQRTIYDAGHTESLPGAVVRHDGQGSTGDLAVDEAFDGLGATFDFYLDAYNRNSIDDEGLHLDASVHYGQNYDNAFWNGSQMVFGDGDGELFDRFTVALDVIGHELTHGVTGDEVGLVYTGE